MSLEAQPLRESDMHLSFRGRVCAKSVILLSRNCLPLTAVAVTRSILDRHVPYYSTHARSILVLGVTS